MIGCLLFYISTVTPQTHKQTHTQPQVFVICRNVQMNYPNVPTMQQQQQKKRLFYPCEVPIRLVTQGHTHTHL